ncbi:MAG: hypothetical protein AVDCRST_MAG38-404 [uncultured Solirubrobacteraceae bacterium]|uniref:Integral membrane protein n=1 Tax=uncultured Solirubrobacteraceae bacterium TaxID=1162706 RepID=A0A6J4R705_9ACTN|nr:MAG: hypothetical protein AVDCRST_MAG38-404 [uncultured Solirubrobacteraceae bacterium]
MAPAAIRPDAWNLPLLVHVAGAMLLVAALVVVLAVAVAAARRDDARPALTRVLLRSLLLGVIPSYLVMRIGAQWVASEQGVGDDATWVGIGYMTAEAGLVLALIAAFLTWRAARRGGRRLLNGVAGISGLLLVAYAITIWAMTAKPT